MPKLIGPFIAEGSGAELVRRKEATKSAPHKKRASAGALMTDFLAGAQRPTSTTSFATSPRSSKRWLNSYASAARHVGTTGIGHGGSAAQAIAEHDRLRRQIDLRPPADGVERGAADQTELEMDRLAALIERVSLRQSSSGTCRHRNTTPIDTMVDMRGLMADGLINYEPISALEPNERP